MKLKNRLMGARLCIRSYSREDLAFSTGMWFDRENGKYLSDPEAGYADGEYQKALDGMEDSPEGYYFIVELKTSETPIGTCCAFPDETGKSYDIGYCIDKKYWGQGYGTETVGLLVNWVRAQGGETVTAEVAVENRASHALLKKHGFTVQKEGEFQKYNMDVRFKSCFYRLCLKERKTVVPGKD